MNTRKRLGFRIVAIGLLAIVACLFWAPTKPPESARKIADAALLNYFDQDQMALKAYPLRRSGTERDHYFFQLWDWLGLGGRLCSLPCYRLAKWVNCRRANARC